MSELKKARWEKRNAAEAQNEGGEEEEVEAVSEEQQGEVLDGRVGAGQQEGQEDNMPGRDGRRDRLEELQALGFGMRSFGYVSPYNGRKNGITARMQASEENREAQIGYELRGKKCQKCKKPFRDGATLKSKVLRCDECYEFVHEKTNACKVDLKRGNQTTYACPPCAEAMKSGAFSQSVF